MKNNLMQAEGKSWCVDNISVFCDQDQGTNIACKIKKNWNKIAGYKCTIGTKHLRIKEHGTEAGPS